MLAKLQLPVPRAASLHTTLSIRGGALSLAELHETGALTAATVPVVASLVALAFLALASARSHEQSDARVPRSLSGSNAMFALFFGTIMCAVQLLRGEVATSALALSACFVVGTALFQNAGLSKAGGSRTASQFASLRHATLESSLATCSALALALPCMLALLLVQSGTSEGAAHGLNLMKGMGAASRAPASIPSASSATDTMVCATHKAVRMLAAAGAGTCASEVLQGVRLSCSLTGASKRGGVGCLDGEPCNAGVLSTQHLLPPLVAALVLAPSPGEMFLVMWMASAGTSMTNTNELI